MSDTSILTALRGTVAGAGAGVVWPGDPHGNRIPGGPVRSCDGGRLPPDLPVASNGGAGVLEHPAPSLSLVQCGCCHLLDALLQIKAAKLREEIFHKGERESEANQLSVCLSVWCVRK
jgi:hypothetical protein